MENFTPDEKVPHLFVRSYGSGSASYVVMFTGGKQRVRKVLAQVGAISLQQARQIAREIMEDSVRMALCLPSSKQRQFSEVAWEFIEKHSKVKKKSWREDERMLRRYLLPAFQHSNIRHITHKNVEDFHFSLRHAPYQANRVLALLSSIFSKAVKWEYCATNPCRGVGKNRELPRDVVLPMSAMPKFLACLSRESLFARTAILLYLLTGGRKSEILALRWEDIDLERKTLRFRKTKNSKPHVLPLTPFAESLLQELPKGSDFLFPSRTASGHLIDIRRQWRRVRADAGLQGLRIHDLRRTLASYLVANGHSVATASKLLNHSSLVVTAKHYLVDMGNVDSALKEFSSLIESHMS